MGTQFFLFYDILIICIFLSIAYKCTRQGFASAVAGFVGLLLSFVIALCLSGVVAEYVYDKWISPTISEKINYSIGENNETSTFNSLRGIDMTKAIISGESINSVSLEPDSTGKINIDLSDIDLSQTGIEQVDLSFFGVDTEKIDFENINLSRISINASELNETDLGTVVLSRALSHEIEENSETSYQQLTEILEDTLPSFLMTSFGSVDLVEKLIERVIDADSQSLESAIVNDLVKPILLIPIRALLFTLVFAIIGVVFSFVVKTLKLINGIPVIGVVNTLGGAVLGVAEAAVTVFIVCIGINLLISITGDSIIFLNTMTIDETRIFRHIYYMDFINLS